VVRESLARLLPDGLLPATPALGGYGTRSNDLEVEVAGAGRQRWPAVRAAWARSDVLLSESGDGIVSSWHDQGMVKLSKAADRLDLFLDLTGPVIGVMFLVGGIETYRDGGSWGWPVGGAAIVVMGLWVVWRRFTRRRTSPPSS
jgi:hypothetical protein